MSMPKRSIVLAAACVAAAAVATTAAAAPKGRARGKDQVQRGAYLVTIGGCNDCHTPWKMGQTGPEMDLARMLSGHPETLKMPDPPPLPGGPWGVVASLTNTAWSGPWGVSFTANLTPDPETGLGKWTEDDFVQTLRTGRHMGRGRQILPPMPWFNYGKGTDEDLKAIWAYLRSIPPIRNKVPEPRPPPASAAAPAPADAPAPAAPAAGKP
jgi:mono/diheme cytochrome c family protein